jgi:hypothetical protein
MTLKIFELTQLDKGKSMSLYFPAKGTAGFARLAVSTLKRDPAPPAMMMAQVFIRHLQRFYLLKEGASERYITEYCCADDDHEKSLRMALR